MDKIFDIVTGSFDFGFMLSVNILTYLIIKTIDQLNGNKVVPVWAKRLIAVGCGIIVGVITVIFSGYSNMILYSFILSLVSWDTVFKPIIKRLKGFDYKKLEE